MAPELEPIVIDKKIFDKILRARDAQWAVVLGCPDGMTPEQAVDWIFKDRRERARNVSEARSRRGPERW